MADNQYPCPECAAILRPAKAINPGQKVKCPKCEHIFVPVPAAKAKKPVDEDSYGFIEQSTQEKEEEEKIQKQTLAPLKDKRPKSARLPAAAICQVPSNRMLALSTATCASCILSIVVVIWPMIFSARKIPGPEMLERWTVVLVCVLAFAYDALATYGAVNMQNIDSFKWAMTGAVLMVFPAQYALGYYGFYWLMTLLQKIDNSVWALGIVALSAAYAWCGVWGIIALRNATVLEGFSQKRSKE